MTLIKSSETLKLNGLTHDNLSGVVQTAIRSAERQLQQFAQRPDFREKMVLPFDTSSADFQGGWVNGVKNVGLKAKDDSEIVVFIDPSVSDYQTLQAGVVKGVEAIALNPNQDGIKQITAVLRQHPEITTIHIVSHGAPGCLYLGNSQLNLDNINNYADLWQRWHSTNILLYGCNVAAGDAGEEFIRKLHEFTNATISASATKTGNAALGGDWNLEVSFPQNDGTFVVFCGETLAAYQGVFVAPVITTTSTALSYIENATTAIDSEIIISDVDSLNLVSATVSISSGFLSTQDILSFTNQNGITGTYNSSTGVLTLTGSATLANYQTALRSVTYTNSSDIPNTTTRIISFQVNDGGLNSGVVTRNVSITPVSDAPVLVNQSFTVNEGSSSIVTNSMLRTTDVDNTDAQLIYTLNTLPVNGILRLNGINLAVNGTFSQDDINNSRVTYIHNGSETTNDSFNFVVSDTTTTITRISTAADGTQVNGNSQYPDISADGRYVMFVSDASNLVSGDTNDTTDIFVKDLTTNSITRVSTAADGTQGNSNSNAGAISANGRFVVFGSNASNLVSGDTNGTWDVFVKDLTTNSITRVSTAADGTQGNSNSSPAVISADGRYVVFWSLASNPVSGDTNGTLDLFIKDLTTNSISRIAAAADGTNGSAYGYFENLAISADGRYVVFPSDASSLVSGDFNNYGDVFVKDLTTNTITSVSTASDGTQGNGNSGYDVPGISADGRYVVFQSYASNLVSGDTNSKSDIFVKDLTTNSITRISTAADGTQGNDDSYGSTISADGRYVVFNSLASNLVSGDTNGSYDVFIKDLITNTITRISTAADGTQGNNKSVGIGISADGRSIVFQSDASNLVSGDTNGSTDVFLSSPRVINGSVGITVTSGNKAPTLANAIADQNAKQGTAFNFQIPSNTFTDIDAGDVLTYSATLENGNALPSWLTFDAATRTFSGTPTNDNVGNLNVKAIATDKAGATVSDIFVIAVENVNDAPTLQNAIADQNAKEDIAFSFTFDANTFIDIDAGDNLSYSATLQDGSNLPNWLKFNAATRTFSGIATQTDLASLIIKVIAKDNKGLSAIDTFALAVQQNNSTPTFKLAKIADDIFNISNSSGKSKIKVTLTERNSNLVNELGVFTVDDAQGKINGIAPGAAGYIQAALERSQVIFSAISNLPNGFNSNNLTHLLEFNSGENLRFYLVKNSTIDAVRTGSTPLTDILFSDPLTQKITDLGNDDFSLAWKDGSGNNATNFNNLVVKFSSTNDSLPLGTNLQGKPQREVIDLRGITSQVKADFVVNREAAFNNFIGFYQVADENGGIDSNGDGKADIFAGQAGYIEAAIRGRVAGIDLTVNNQGTATYTGTFQPGTIFATFIIVDGRPEALLDSNPNNNPAVYFPYIEANADKVDHIRLLGNNIFGFEDLPTGGDKDFNDVIVRVNLSIV